MKSLFTPAWQKHFKYVQQSREIAFELLEHPRVRDALGPRAVGLSAFMEYIKPVAVMPGHPHVCSDDICDSVPLIGVGRAEAVQVHHTKANSLQMMNVKNRYGSMWAETFLSRCDEPYSVHLPEQCAATCLSKSHIIYPTETCMPSTPPVVVRGQSLIAMQYLPRFDIRETALSLIHEADHAELNTLAPIQYAESMNHLRLRAELRAYSTESVVAKAAGVVLKNPLPHIIETIRSEVNGDLSGSDPYEPNDKMIAHLGKKGLTAIYASS